MTQLTFKRNHPGSYTTHIWDGRVEVQITRNDERDSSWYGQWIITSGQDYSDPIPTLARAKAAVQDQEDHPEKYGVFPHVDTEKIQKVLGKVREVMHPFSGKAVILVYPDRNEFTWRGTHYRPESQRKVNPENELKVWCDLLSQAQVEIIHSDYYFTYDRDLVFNIRFRLPAIPESKKKTKGQHEKEVLELIQASNVHLGGSKITKREEGPLKGTYAWKYQTNFRYLKLPAEEVANRVAKRIAKCGCDIIEIRSDSKGSWGDLVLTVRFRIIPQEGK